MKIVITGPKCSGKSTVGKKLAADLGLKFIETDTLIEEAYENISGEKLSFYDVYQRVGEAEFRRLEKEAAERASALDWCVLSTGGSSFLRSDLRRNLRNNAIVALLDIPFPELWQRLQGQKKSKYLRAAFARERFEKRVELVKEVVTPFADIIFEGSDSAEAVTNIRNQLADELAVFSNRPNSLGEIIRLTTFGESHGKALGAVLDGLPPGIEIDSTFIQNEMNRRRPGQSKVSTSRMESDEIEILSGVFNGKTTGSPLTLTVRNKDQDSSKYEAFRHLFRPGHADISFFRKYGFRDYRGGGRSSGRETVGRIAGGAVAKQILAARNVAFVGYSLEIAGVRCYEFDENVIENNIVRAPDLRAAEDMEKAILAAKEEGDSVGGIVELKISGVPAGLGDPVFGKLDARLAGALTSLGAVKGIEFGDGFRAVAKKGSDFNDQMGDGGFATNNAGGILGGISNGEQIVIRLAIKPTPSISKPQKTCDAEGDNREISIDGRHDPCIVPRIVPVVESMAALVILDTWEIQNRLNPDWLDNRTLKTQ